MYVKRDRIKPSVQFDSLADIVRYMGDRWLSTNLMASTYIWLPLTLSGTSASLVRILLFPILGPKPSLSLTKTI